MIPKDTKPGTTVWIAYLDEARETTLIEYKGKWSTVVWPGGKLPIFDDMLFLTEAEAWRDVANDNLKEADKLEKKVLELRAMAEVYRQKAKRLEWADV